MHLYVSEKQRRLAYGERDPFLWPDALSMPTPQLLVFVYLTNLPAGICLSIFPSIRLLLSV
jgi:hypothetical protein